MAAGEASTARPRQEKQYDYLLKFLLVGDSDVGKQEILSGLEDGAAESPFCSGSGSGEDFSECSSNISSITSYKTTTILLDGKRVKLQLWDTSGQGRFCTIIRSYSRGAQGILLVYDITNKWSFDGIDRWLKEVEEHAPGVPKVLVGNRLHLAFKRQVGERDAEAYAAKNRMAFFEVSPLCDFNIRESFSELSRMALHRNGMERLWRSNKVLSLQELACRAIVARTTVYGIDQLPLPKSIKSHLKSYAMTTTSQLAQLRYGNRSLSSSKSLGSHHRKLRFVGVGHNNGGLSTPGSSPGSIADSRTSCVGRNSCTVS
ncbi:ras-related protein Rab-40C isoform X1 [Temnothorax curvispinosus]|uniref:Ras-related protein Rab-40C isoform X1 n=1 Tax=Temnothorax curvispinosus TaxID=300111 RepID=A0A6J1PZE7_9HYME|nr:ras-related protein Rab-40C isoform X1 [Temnothorax curvispinosus]